MEGLTVNAHIEPHAAKLIGCGFTVQVGNDPKRAAKPAQSFWRQRN